MNPPEESKQSVDCIDSTIDEAHEAALLYEEGVRQMQRADQLASELTDPHLRANTHVAIGLHRIALNLDHHNSFEAARADIQSRNIVDDQCIAKLALAECRMGFYDQAHTTLQRICRPQWHSHMLNKVMEEQCKNGGNLTVGIERANKKLQKIREDTTSSAQLNQLVSAWCDVAILKHSAGVPCQEEAEEAAHVLLSWSLKVGDVFEYVHAFIQVADMQERTGCDISVTFAKLVQYIEDVIEKKSIDEGELWEPIDCLISIGKIDVVTYLAQILKSPESKQYTWSAIARNEVRTGSDHKQSQKNAVDALKEYKEAANMNDSEQESYATACITVAEFCIAHGDVATAFEQIESLPDEIKLESCADIISGLQEQDVSLENCLDEMLAVVDECAHNHDAIRILTTLACAAHRAGKDTEPYVTRLLSNVKEEDALKKMYSYLSVADVYSMRGDNFDGTLLTIRSLLPTIPMQYQPGALRRIAGLLLDAEMDITWVMEEFRNSGPTIQQYNAMVELLAEEGVWGQLESMIGNVSRDTNTYQRVALSYAEKGSASIQEALSIGSKLTTEQQGELFCEAAKESDSTMVHMIGLVLSQRLPTSLSEEKRAQILALLL